MKHIVAGLLLIISCSVFLSCEHIADYTANDENTDSLFLGISLGMERQAFYDHCWEQNKKKLFMHGPSNQSVEYKIVDRFETPVSMRFYPSFHEDKIYEMPVIFTYDAWAPWNREYWADSLLVNMLPLFKEWYGDEFKKLDHPTMGDVYYKIDGKRRINLFRKDDQQVQAVFTDLEVERELKKAYAERMKKEEENLQ